MLRVLALAGLLSGSLLVAGAQESAVAVPPHPGKYTGATVEGQDKAVGSITIKAKNASTLSLIRHVDSCGDVSKVRNVSVKANGSFTAELIRRDTVNVLLWKISGKFVGDGAKARGTIAYVGCEEDVVFSALET